LAGFSTNGQEWTLAVERAAAKAARVLFSVVETVAQSSTVGLGEPAVSMQKFSGEGFEGSLWFSKCVHEQPIDDGRTKLIPYLEVTATLHGDAPGFDYGVARQAALVGALQQLWGKWGWTAQWVSPRGEGLALIIGRKRDAEVLYRIAEVV
jgi:hypothetical protein